MKKLDAVVVGSGPNGLAAAIVLARAGHSVRVLEGQPTLGGGARTQELTRPGFRHDLCSAIHPLAAASPFFRTLDLASHGVEFLYSPASLAHPLDTGVALLQRSVEATAASLGVDETPYLRLMGPLVRDFDEVMAPLMMNPITSVPRAPLRQAMFGLKALESAAGFAAETFQNPLTKALLAGCAAHSFAPLTRPLTNAFSLILAAAGHAVGWPMIRGGSGVLVEGLVQVLKEAGGELEVNRPVRSLAELPESSLVLFDTHAEVMERICGDALPDSYRKRVRAFRRGPGVFKLDYALSGPMPWKDERCAQAATVHVGGTLEEVTESEAAVDEGTLSDAPFVLVAQQSLFDASRAPAGQHTLWAYCHVPNGSTVDATAAIERQLERFAPGFQRLVLARHVKTPQDFEAGNASDVGGDISGGAVDGLQTFFRPTLGMPYATPNPRLLICSSSAPPGPGVHGMSGFHAARLALRRLERPGSALP